MPEGWSSVGSRSLRRVEAANRRHVAHQASGEADRGAISAGLSGRAMLGQHAWRDLGSAACVRGAHGRDPTTGLRCPIVCMPHGAPQRGIDGGVATAGAPLTHDRRADGSGHRGGRTSASSADPRRTIDHLPHHDARPRFHIRNRGLVGGGGGGAPHAVGTARPAGAHAVPGAGGATPSVRPVRPRTPRDGPTCHRATGCQAAAGSSGRHRSTQPPSTPS